MCSFSYIFVLLSLETLYDGQKNEEKYLLTIMQIQKIRNVILFTLYKSQYFECFSIFFFFFVYVLHAFLTCVGTPMPIKAVLIRTIIKPIFVGNLKITVPSNVIFHANFEKRIFCLLYTSIFSVCLITKCVHLYGRCRQMLISLCVSYIQFLNSERKVCAYI